MPPDGQVVMESTPQGAGGLFYEEWRHADETGYVRHFLPWWLEKAYRVPGVGAGKLKEDEIELMQKHHLDEEQIVYRRGLQAELRKMMQQEYAESPEECFLASGDCVFDVPLVEERLKQIDTISTRKRSRTLPSSWNRSRRSSTSSALTPQAVASTETTLVRR